MSTLTLHQMTTARIIIVGAGAAGLFSAWSLAEAGFAVEVYDRGPIGRGAIWASGGMLGAGFESAVELVRQPHAAGVSAWLQEGLSLWDETIVRLQHFAKQPLGYARPGTLTPIFQRADEARMNEIVQSAHDLGLSLEPLSAREAQTREPGLGACHGALYFPGDGHLDNRALVTALIAMCQAKGVRFHAGVEVWGLERSGGAVTGIRLGQTGEDVRHADAVFLAHGAQTLLGEGRETYPIHPVKGQMIAFQARDRIPLHVIRGFNIYITAKPGGRVVIGATSEPGKGDCDIDDQACAHLAERARMAYPSLAEARLVERWAGLRPAAQDFAPLIGPSQTPGLYYLAGAYRNGVLLGPLYGRAALAMMTGAPLGLNPIFTPMRFGL
ncbi:NAD(P)/FAD-dependent oxidoreductase [Woodsholea maritima]|uniref:NAD(P)/FAD-dependent oxidoreductase n=1 Tax=Woodsholea maritima TaxID=240237 RepID=UPI0003634F41|nr:FAD-dependent oxidoreductase [Woodsholea maritima]